MKAKAVGDPEEVKDNCRQNQDKKEEGSVAIPTVIMNFRKRNWTCLWVLLKNRGNNGHAWQRIW